MTWLYAYLGMALLTMFGAVRKISAEGQAAIDQAAAGRGQPRCHDRISPQEFKANCLDMHIDPNCWRADRVGDVFQRDYGVLFSGIGWGVIWPIWWLLLGLLHSPRSSNQVQAAKRAELQRRERDLAAAEAEYKKLTEGK